MTPNIQQIFDSIPQRFRPEKAQNYEGIFHFDISDSKDNTLKGGQFTISIQQQKCTIEQGIQGKAACIIRANAEVYINIETGKTNPQMALMTGKVKVSNLAEMLQFAKFFKRFSVKYLEKKEAQPPIEDTFVPSRKPTKGPLKDIRILDLSRLLPAPLATMHLADLGAEVIKIEDPESPDGMRNFPPFVGTQSAYYLALNRSKRSLTLNLHSVEGKEIFFHLLLKSDIVIESFRPNVLKKIGIDYETAKILNPKIIYVSVTGYGQNSPYSQHAGHDLNYISYAGIQGLTGQNDNSLSMLGVQLADIAGGSYMTINACLLALWNRERTGKGEHIDLAMTDACLPFISLPMAHYWATQQQPKTGELLLSGKLPNYNIYQCKDLKFIALGALEPKFWAGFCEMIKRPEWSDQVMPNSPKLASIKAELRQLFQQKTQAEWLEQSKDYDICLTPVYQLSELENDPHLQTRQVFREHTHTEYGTSKTIAQPLKFTNTPLDKGWAAPILSEDTHAILQELGYEAEAIQRFKKEGVV